MNRGPERGTLAAPSGSATVDDMIVTAVRLDYTARLRMNPLY